jgi:predicted RNA-binding protein with PIN domain
LKSYLLIDGYNFMNAWWKLKGMEFGDLEEAREKLIDELIEYKWYTGENVAIIFDAYLVKGNLGKRERRRGIEVIFTKENETADSYIEKKVEMLTRDKRNHVRVATSDWAEQQMVLGSGAIRVSARELVIELESAKRNIRKKVEKTKQNRMTVEERIDEKILETLERWRRNR